MLFPVYCSFWAIYLFVKENNSFCFEYFLCTDAFRQMDQCILSFYSADFAKLRKKSQWDSVNTCIEVFRFHLFALGKKSRLAIFYKFE